MLANKLSNIQPRPQWVAYVNVSYHDVNEMFI